jgi:hypothetical protein
VYCPGKTNPESRWSKVNLGECPLAAQSLGLLTSRVPKLRCRASTPPGLHYVSGAPLCHVRFGTSRIAGYSLRVFCCWNPRLPNPRYSGFVPPVSLGVDGPDQIAGSHFAISTCMEFLHSPTPIHRYAMAKGSFAV